MSAQNRIQNVLKRAQQLDISPTFLPYSGVEIITGAKDEDGKEVEPYFAGDRSGRVLTINNPWGTQAQADDIIAKIRGVTYQPYEAVGALVDPNAELGDGVSVNDVYSGIYKLSRDFSSLMSADVSAPQSEDLDHEYPYEPKADRVATRKFSSMESELAINSKEISAKVSVEGGENRSVSWNLTAQDWSVYANGNLVFKIDSTGAEVVGRITATSGRIGGFTINENGSNAIQYNGLTWNGNKTGVFIGTQGIQLGNKSSSYFQASASGDVTARNVTLLGTLYFKDSSGTTRSITADNLRAGAQSAYNNGGAWTSTTNGWNGATASSTANAVSRFNCRLLYVTGNVIYVEGTGAYWQQKEVRLASGGTSKIIYLGRATV